MSSETYEVCSYLLRINSPHSHHALSSHLSLIAIQPTYSSSTPPPTIQGTIPLTYEPTPGYTQDTTPSPVANIVSPTPGPTQVGSVL